MPELIDIGCNLTHESFAPDLDVVLERAATAGVHRLIVTGTSVAASREALMLSRRFAGRLYATTGVHPHHADDLQTDDVDRLAELAAQPACVAVGECGLDYFRNYSSEHSQLRAFEAQLELAVAVAKPVFLHQRDAHDPFLAVLDRYVENIPGGVAHCFTGGRGDMQDYLDRGLHIGITGWICDERRGEALRDAVRALPLDRLLLETDAPYLLPRDLPEKPRGRRNEPALLAHVLETVAHHMGESPATVAAAATRNTERLFGLPAASVAEQRAESRGHGLMPQALPLCPIVLR